jgi:hypothetical protein
VTGEQYLVKDGDFLALGHHKLRFYMTPMVHWPETMMTFDETEGILFSGDGFGCFGTLDGGFLGIVNDVTGDKSISIGAIEVTNKFTFFDVFADQVEKVVTAFAGESDYIVSEAKGSKSFEGGRKPEYRTRSNSSESRSGGYRGSERSPRSTETSGGGDKPWRNRERTDERGSRRPSSSAGKERKSSTYRKRS